MHRLISFCLFLLPAIGLGADPPNILLIVADDMGVSDLGCYGGEIETPNLDALAESGIRFTNFYTNNMCVPCRASLLSGLYPQQAKPKSHFAADVATLPEILRETGYATIMSGKWHLCNPGDRANDPNGRGFDDFYGTILGASDFFAPTSLMRNGVNVESEWRDTDKPYYYTDRIVDNALAFLSETHTENPDRPFFCYLAFTAAHWPLHAWPEDIEKYQGRYAMGWDELRRRRHARMKELGVVNPDWPLSPRDPEVPAWEEAPEPEWQQRRMEVYAAQVDRMDQQIGRVLEWLRKTGKFDNTLVVFQIDNGGCHVEYTTKRKGPFLLEKTRDGRPIRAGNIPGLMPGGQETFQSYGYGWANASNTPFRLFKQHDHEGGIRSPLIIHWPALLGNPGRLEPQVAHVIDLTPTFLEAAGVDFPSKTGGGETPVPMEGRSLLSVFKGEQRKPHDQLFWSHARGRAVREGKWKLVQVKGGDWELYDIETDGTEMNDLAAEKPQKVTDLKAAHGAWMKRTRAR